MKIGLVAFAASALLLAGCSGKSVMPAGHLGGPGSGAAGHGAHPTITSSITEVHIPQANSGATGITAGPDGNVWFTEYLKNSIAVMNVATNQITRFKLSARN